MPQSSINYINISSLKSIISYFDVCSTFNIIHVMFTLIDFIYNGY